MRKWLAEGGREKTAPRSRVQISIVKVKDVRGTSVETSMLDFSGHLVVNNGVLVFTDDVDTQFYGIIFA